MTSDFNIVNLMMSTSLILAFPFEVINLLRKMFCASYSFYKLENLENTVYLIHWFREYFAGMITRTRNSLLSVGS